jgi:hypothetical protein
VGAGTRHPAPGAAAPDTGRTEFRSIKVIDLDGAPEADRFPHGARAIKVIRRRRTGKAHPSVETVYALTSLDHRAAGHSHVTVDGTLVRTDRCRVPGPTARADRPERRVDLWWSGKHAAHGGNVQVIAAPDGWPIWTSGVRPGREHDTTALRAHAEALPLLAERRPARRWPGSCGRPGWRSRWPGSGSRGVSCAVGPRLRAGVAGCGRVAFRRRFRGCRRRRWRKGPRAPTAASRRPSRRPVGRRRSTGPRPARRGRRCGRP